MSTKTSEARSKTDSTTVAANRMATPLDQIRTVREQDIKAIQERTFPSPSCYAVITVKDENGGSKNIIRFGPFRNHFKPIMEKAIDEVKKEDPSLWVPLQEPAMGVELKFLAEIGVITILGDSLFINDHCKTGMGQALLTEALSGKSKIEPIERLLR